MTLPDVHDHAATIVRVHDGDTIYADVDLDFHTWIKDQSIRLLGCNARELAEPGGAEAYTNLVDLLPVGSQVVLSTMKPDKYGGRILSVVTLPDGTDLVAHLIATEWAAPWNGVGVKPLPPWPRTL